jgi:HSP20 family protein
MAITLWRDRQGSPWGLLDNLKSEMDHWFDDYFSRGSDLKKSEGFFKDRDLENYPAVDIMEKDGKYIVHAELPGVKKDDIQVEYNNGYVTIKGEKKFEHEEKKKDFHRIERSYGSFSRMFEIPSEIKEEGIKAEYKNGVLELSLPMKDPAKSTARKIKIE